MLGAGLEPQRDLHGLSRSHIILDACKTRFQCRSPGKSQIGQTENNRNRRKGTLVHLSHEFEWGWPDGNNYIEFAIPILAKVKVAKLLLGGWFRKQYRI